MENRLLKSQFDGSVISVPVCNEVFEHADKISGKPIVILALIAHRLRRVLGVGFRDRLANIGGARSHSSSTDHVSLPDSSSQMLRSETIGVSDSALGFGRYKTPAYLLHIWITCAIWVIKWFYIIGKRTL